VSVPLVSDSQTADPRRNLCAVASGSASAFRGEELIDASQGSFLESALLQDSQIGSTP
jgi:hypothetical protein